LLLLLVVDPVEKLDRENNPLPVVPARRRASTRRYNSLSSSIIQYTQLLAHQEERLAFKFRRSSANTPSRRRSQGRPASGLIHTVQHWHHGLAGISFRKNGFIIKLMPSCIVIRVRSGGTTTNEPQVTKLAGVFRRSSEKVEENQI
jgi:hypothetical protein